VWVHVEDVDGTLERLHGFGTEVVVGPDRREPPAAEPCTTPRPTSTTSHVTVGPIRKGDRAICLLPYLGV
jgi:hypothetical protein